MLNINGLVKITKFEEIGENTVKATIYFGTKRKNSNGEEWENSFFNSVLIGKALEKSYEIAEKDSIYITQGLVKNVSYKDKEGKNRSYLSLTIFDFEYEEDKIKALLEQNSNKPKKEEKKKRERKKA